MKHRSIIFFLVLTFCVGEAFGQPFWQLVNNTNYNQSFAATDNGNIYTMRNYALLEVSTADGASFTWTQRSGFPTVYGNRLSAVGNAVFVLNSNDNAYDGRGVYVSTDDGLTWTQRNNGLGADTNVVDLFPLANGVALAVTQLGSSLPQKLYRSTNLGVSWTFVQTLTNGARSVKAYSSTLAYFTNGTSIWRSTDNGSTWASLNSVSPNNNIQEFVIQQNGDLISHDAVSAIASVDGGVTFTARASVGLPAPMYGGAIVNTPSDTVYITTETIDGIYYSADDGASWTSAGTGCPYVTQTYFPNMVVSRRGYLFACLGGISVWRSINRVAGNLVGVAGDDFPAQAVTAYPNPSSGSFVVATGSGAADGVLEVWDLAGRPAACDILWAGDRWQVNGLAAGMFCYRVRSLGDGRLVTGKVVVK